MYFVNKKSEDISCIEQQLSKCNNTDYMKFIDKISFAYLHQKSSELCTTWNQTMVVLSTEGFPKIKRRCTIHGVTV